MTTEIHPGAVRSGIARPALPRPASIAASRASTRSVVVAMGAIGGLMAVIGTALPWLSLYAGLQSITGLEGLTGRALAVLGAIAVTAALAHAVRGDQPSRWLLGIVGFALLGFAGWLGVQLLQTSAALAADPLLISRLEPGLGVSIIGGSLVFATLFVPAERTRGTTRPALGARHLVLAITLSVAGIIHLALTPEHLAGSIVLGLGFLGTGVAQLLLAAGVALTRSVLAVRLAVGISIFAVAALIAAITVGLPILAHGGSMGLLGPVEPLDDLGALTGLVQAVTIGVGISMLRARTAAAVPTR